MSQHDEADPRRETRAQTRSLIERRLARRCPVPAVQRGLVADLEGAGVAVSDDWDLVSIAGRYTRRRRS
jgi:hypothetical protein